MEKFKTQEETAYLDNIAIVPSETVLFVITRRYNVVWNKSEHKYSSKTLASVLCNVRIYAKIINQESTLATGFKKIW